MKLNKGRCTLDANVNTYWRKNQYLLIICQFPIDANVKENITSINNTSNNNINRIDILSGNPTRIPYKEIIDYLNEKTGKKFSHKSKANQNWYKLDLMKIIQKKISLQ